jgi:hypothetical protein
LKYIERLDMCVTCEKLYAKISKSRKAQTLELYLDGKPRHYSRPCYSRMISADVSINTYWTLAKVLDFEKWLVLNGFKINPKRTKWIDRTKIMFMLKYKSRKDTSKENLNLAICKVRNKCI